jgi:hypothetical protein
MSTLRSLARFFVCGAVWLALAAPPASAGDPAPSPASSEAEDCLACHGDAELTRALKDGTQMPLFVDAAPVAASVHGAKLRCTDCHRGYDALPHPERTYADASAFRAALRETCSSCHFEKRAQVLDGMHAAVVTRGDARAPSCVECHGAHDVKRPREPRTRVSETCGRCHAGVAATYAASVHGRALKSGDADVPTCADCHRAHDVSGPRDAQWLLRSPELCGTCHTDEKRMARHGLSPNVLKTYLADFHGATASLARGRHAGDGRVTALCTDCHGVHDIAKVDAPGSRVVKENLGRTCARCHEGAGKSFSAAWLSHYEPSLDKAPFVFLVRLGYLVLIPFMIGGLVLQVLLHFWRVVVNR